MNAIRLGLGNRELTSENGGASWSEGARCLPERGAPWTRGAMQRRPKVSSPVTLDGVVVDPSGIGLAAAHERFATPDPGAREGVALLFRTEDHGRSWARIEPRLSLMARTRARSSWPPERIEDVAVQRNGTLAFTWTDPWLFDGADSHLMVSRNAGSTWSYTRLPGMCAALAVSTDDVVRVVGVGELWLHTTSSREHVVWRWARGGGEGFGEPGLLRCARFLSTEEAIALVVALPHGVGFARTADGGRTWRIEHAWHVDGALERRDMNERGVLVLEAD